MATRWRPRVRGPALLVRGMDSYVELEVWGPSGLQEPASGTITVYAGDDTVIVNAQAVVVDSSSKRATATILAASLPSTLELSDRWRVAWSLSLAGESATFYQDAQLIRRPWFPTVVQDDILSASPQLRNSYSTDSVDDNEALELIINAVTEDTQTKLVSNGSRPWLIFDPWKLNAYVVQVCLARIFRSHLFDNESANFASLDKLATTHEEAAEVLWSGMNFRYDKLETGKGNDQVEKQGPSVVRLGITRAY